MRDRHAVEVRGKNTKPDSTRGEGSQWERDQANPLYERRKDARQGSKIS